MPTPMINGIEVGDVVLLFLRFFIYLLITVAVLDLVLEHVLDIQIATLSGVEKLVRKVFVLARSLFFLGFIVSLVVYIALFVYGLAVINPFLTILVLLPVGYLLGLGSGPAVEGVAYVIVLVSGEK